MISCQQLVRWNFHGCLCHPLSHSHPTQDTTWLKQLKPQAGFLFLIRRLFLQSVSAWKFPLSLKNKKSQVTAEGTLPSVMPLTHSPPLRSNFELVFVFLRSSGLTMDTHSGLSWHAHYWFVISFSFPTAPFFPSWVISYLEKHRAERHGGRQQPCWRTTWAEEGMFSVELPLLQNELEVLLLYGGWAVRLRSVLGAPRPHHLRESTQETVKSRTFLLLPSTPHLFLLSACHNKCHTAHVGVRTRDTWEEATWELVVDVTHRLSPNRIAVPAAAGKCRQHYG